MGAKYSALAARSTNDWMTDQETVIYSFLDTRKNKLHVEMELIRKEYYYNIFATNNSKNNKTPHQLLVVNDSSQILEFNTE